jgi:cation:H+ antiporter
LGLSEALLGMLAALAADAPEITASVTALAGHHARIGAGVVIGSNVFNLAALLGLSAVVAGEVTLDRRVIIFEGTVAMVIAAVCLGVVLGGPGPGFGLLAAVAVLVPYVIVSGVDSQRLGRFGLPQAWVHWLSDAVVEEERELEPAIHPPPADTRDVIVAVLATGVVIGASVAMELTASTFGARHHVAEIVIGGLVLAGVTSLPNAVSALYLAARGRGAATLSIALNSNALNVTVGLLLPGVLVGLGAPSGQGTLVAACYFALTAVTLACAYAGRGLRRSHGALIISGYLAFVAAVLITS